jgi:hypothetical protein
MTDVNSSAHMCSWRLIIIEVKMLHIRIPSVLDVYTKSVAIKILLFWSMKDAKPLIKFLHSSANLL